MGLTRGIEDNTVLVVTESCDLDEARDILDRIVSVDRADVPATTQRRELAAADRNPRQPIPRCDVPDWLPALRDELTHHITDLEQCGVARAAELRSLRTQLAEAEEVQARTQRRLDPHQPGLDQAWKATQAAQERAWAVYNRGFHLKGRRRRANDREHRDAQQELAVAKNHLAALEAAAAPARDGVNVAAKRVDEVRQEIRSIETFQRWSPRHEQIEQLRTARHAVDEWERWATGKSTTPGRVVAALDGLRSDAVSDWPECAALADVLQRWAAPRGIVPTPAIAQAAPSGRSPSLGIDL